MNSDSSTKALHNETFAQKNAVLQRATRDTRIDDHMADAVRYGQASECVDRVFTPDEFYAADSATNPLDQPLMQRFIGLLEETIQEIGMTAEEMKQRNNRLFGAEPSASLGAKNPAKEVDGGNVQHQFDRLSESLRGAMEDLNWQHLRQKQLI